MGRRETSTPQTSYDAPRSHGRHWRFGSNLPREAMRGIRGGGPGAIGWREEAAASSCRGVRAEDCRLASSLLALVRFVAIAILITDAFSALAFSEGQEQLDRLRFSDVFSQLEWCHALLILHAQRCAAAVQQSHDLGRPEARRPVHVGVPRVRIREVNGHQALVEGRLYLLHVVILCRLVEIIEQLSGRLLRVRR